MISIVGRKLVTDHIHALVLPIINLPAGTKRIRIRQRSSEPCRFFVRTTETIEQFVGGYVDDETAIELIPSAKRNLIRVNSPDSRAEKND